MPCSYKPVRITPGCTETLMISGYRLANSEARRMLAAFEIPYLVHRLHLNISPFEEVMSESRVDGDDGAICQAADEMDSTRTSEPGLDAVLLSVGIKSEVRRKWPM